MTLHSSSARLDGIHLVQIHLFKIHVITVKFVIKRLLSLYEFTPWGRDLLSVVRIRESPYYRGFFFKENIGEFFRDMETVRNIERCRYREVRLYN